MQLDARGLALALRASFRDPRGVARALIGLNLGPATGGMALALVAVLSALLSSLALRLAPLLPDPAVAAVFASPLLLVLLQGGVLLATAMLVHAVGHAFGGKGRFSDALVLMAWIEAVLLVLQVAQIAALVLLPPLADIAGIFAVVALLWLMAHFVAELHGFASAGAVLMGLIATFLALSMALAILAVAVLGLGA